MWIATAGIYAMLAAQASASTPPLKPTGKWTVAYEQEMCLLMRDYGKAGETLQYGIKPITFGEVADVLLIIDGSRSGQSYRMGQAKITVQSGAAPIEGRFRSWRLGGKALRVIAVEVPRSALPAIAASGEISISADKTDIRIAQTGGTKALAALDTCEKNMIEAFSAGATTVNDLSIDAPEHLAAAAAAKGNPAYWLTSNDYPSEAVQLGLDGMTAARWIIGTDGRVKRCLITARSDHPALDDLVCTVLEQRARYKPATDKDGKPVESVAFRRVVWKLP